MEFIKDVTVREWEDISLADPASVDCKKCEGVIHLNTPAETDLSRGFYGECECGESMYSGVAKDFSIRRAFKDFLDKL